MTAVAPIFGIVILLFLVLWVIGQEPYKIAYIRWLGALQEEDPKRFHRLWPYGDAQDEFDQLVERVKLELTKYDYSEDQFRTWEIEVLDHLLDKWPGFILHDFDQALKMAQEIGLIDAKLRPNRTAANVDEKARRRQEFVKLYGEETAAHYCDRPQSEPPMEDDDGLF